MNMLRGNSLSSKSHYNPLTTYKSKLVGWLDTSLSAWEGTLRCPSLLVPLLAPFSVLTHPFLAYAIGVRSHSLPIMVHRFILERILVTVIEEGGVMSYLRGVVINVIYIHNY